MSNVVNTSQTSTSRSLIKRFGFAGFMFFFLKGMAWLSLPALLAFLN